MGVYIVCKSFLTASALKQLQAASGSVEAFASRLVAVSVLVHDMLRLPSGKVRCPVSAMVAEAGGGVRATIAKLPLPCSKWCPSAWPMLMMASALAHGKLRLLGSCKKCSFD
ncbi:hypothetical protein PF002_g4484 [Phytophthora fragariae]|uniref:Uncharacterized protein n=2 Tax=Phytophthora fragariae TaxID=53985 RepID=A0A6A4A3V9_9STRA|nr:hypothetical protein PF002_g4484 [Phytophthora fragariae]